MARLFGATCIGVLLGVAPVAAEADGPDYFRVVAVASNDVLAVRDAPSAGARRVGAIPHNANGIRNLGCRGGLSFAEWQRASPGQREASRRRRWCRVSYRGVTGWAAARFLAEGSGP